MNDDLFILHNEALWRHDDIVFDFVEMYVERHPLPSEDELLIQSIVAMAQAINKPKENKILIDIEL